MGALDDDELALERTNEWNLPADAEGFRAWCRENGITVEEFMDLPAWNNAPPGLRLAIMGLDSAPAGG